ncbi:MAG: flagellar FliJ family protein [Candidatus Nanopelagicales bacterium]
MSTEDRGLQAVARVRGVRERDSKTGLQQAGRIVDERVAELDGRRRQLAGASGFDAGSGGEFLSRRAELSSMADAASAAAEHVELGRSVAAQALGRWQHDRSRLRAVELLAERRAQRLREDRMRAEVRDLDEVAGSSWLRKQPSQEQP